jgi:hypothetical protein
MSTNQSLRCAISMGLLPEFRARGNDMVAPLTGKFKKLIAEQIKRIYVVVGINLNLRAWGIQFQRLEFSCGY